MKNRFIEIDILRVLAICFIIMVRHIDDYANEMFQCKLIIDLTDISLGILVFISGYVLSNTNAIFNSFADIKKFIVKRILRIYPLYALALLMFYFLAIINVHKLISGLLLYNLYTGEYILTLWFIPMIMAFYLVFILLNYKYDLRKFLSISFCIFLLLLIERIMFKNFESVLILYFPSFICGFLAAKYSDYLNVTTQKAIFLLIIFLMIILLKDLAPSRLRIMLSTMMIVSFSLPAMFLLSKTKIQPKLMQHIINLSYASFCMYLIHRAIFSIALLIYKPSTDIFTLIYLYIVAIPVIYVVSFNMQRYYDKLLGVKLQVRG